MKFLAFLIVFLLAIILMPGASSISIKSSGCAEGSCFSDTMSIDAPKDATVNYDAVFSGGKSAQKITGKGNLHKLYRESSVYGDEVSISADVLFAKGYEYENPMRIPGEAYLRDFSLTANDALSISCDAKASSRDGASARVKTDIFKGSLNGFRSSAKASENGAIAEQYAGLTSGALVSFSSSSSSGNGLSSRAETFAIGSTFSDYSTSAHSTPQVAGSLQEFHSAEGDLISASSWELTPDSLLTGQSAVLQGSIAGYSSRAEANSSSEGPQVTQDIAGAEGERIRIADTSISQSVATVSTDVKNGNIPVLTSRSYIRSMEMGGESIKVPDTWQYASAAGEEVTVKSTSTGLLNYADSTTTIENGSISLYLNEAASHPYAGIAAQLAGEATGERIYLEASSADYMSTSSVHAESNIQEGSLETFYSGTGANILLSETGGIQLSPGSLIAVQRVSDFTGDASLSARADIMDLNMTSELSVPPGFRSFLQLARTQDVDPLAFQMFSPLPDNVPDPFAGFWLP